MTVVYELEQPLLELQARSFARYLDPTSIHRIVVVDNSRPRMHAATRSHMVKSYGALQPLVDVIRPEHIGIYQDTSGDRGQQALKLAVANAIEVPRYIVLDSKNHLIQPLTSTWLHTADGTPRTRVHTYAGHPREAGLRSVLEYFGLDPALLTRFVASTTPFTIDTAVARSLMHHIEAAAGTDFVSAFIRTSMTEFPLYAAWLIRNGGAIEQHYQIDGTFVPTVWPHLATPAGIADVVRQADAGAPMFAVHREALMRLHPDGAAVLSPFWTSRGLFSSPAAVDAFLTDFRHRYRVHWLRGKARRAPRRAARELRHLGGRLLDAR